jgi:hypothetical protein
MKAIVFACVIACAVGTAAGGQEPGMNVELAGTASLIGGWMPVSVNGVSYVDPYAGVRADGSIQLEHVQFGAAIRLWEMQRADTYGGGGQTFYLVSEIRPNRGSHASLRFAYGYDHNTVDPGGGPARPEVVADAAMGAIGLGYEFNAPSNARMQLTLDVWLPAESGKAIALRQPALEIGIGYRVRAFQPIRPIPSRGR